MNDFSILKGYAVCKVRKKTLIKYVKSAFLPCYCIYCHFCHFLLAFTASATYSAHVRLASEFKITLCAYNFSYIIPFDPGDTSFESPHWELFKTGLKSDIRWFGAPPYILENFRRHSVSSALRMILWYLQSSNLNVFTINQLTFIIADVATIAMYLLNNITMSYF